ncbi:hypothetical protein ACFO4M_17865 [Pseudonocardia nematodicida]|uniref:hypothetical protein n=1 Tax=Pseudonocardia nematodicida TaxID=1206997 RepID=UPI00361A68A7
MRRSLPGRRHPDWPLDDPAGRGVDDVRPIHDEIDRRVRGSLDELSGDTSGAEDR